jgi:hypothetical protein
MDATQPKSPLVFDVAARLAVTTCPACGIAFAIPAALYLARANEKGSIHCPGCGEARALDRDAEPAEDWLALGVQQLLEIQQLKHRVRQAEGELEQLRPKMAEAQPPDAAEIKRRANILAERSRPGATYGKRICRYCGKGSTSLYRHLMRVHKDELAAEPAATFAV